MPGPTFFCFFPPGAPKFSNQYIFPKLAIEQNYCSEHKTTYLLCLLLSLRITSQQKCHIFFSGKDNSPRTLSFWASGIFFPWPFFFRNRSLLLIGCSIFVRCVFFAQRKFYWKQTITNEKEEILLLFEICCQQN